MSILSPIHLFEQADRLVAPPPAGPPRQVDLRRAISSSYDAIFHLTLTALADEFVGAAHRGSSRHALVHRGVDHRAIKDVCSVILQGKPPAKYGPYVPTDGFGRGMMAFASAFIDVQEKRHRADYDVAARHRTLDARLAITTGRSAMAGFTGADASERRIFLTLLLCRPR